jgi:hypothetical protein
MAKIQLSEPVRVRLSRPADMAAAIPHLIGFTPEESLIVISLRGPRKRIGLTMRWDLPPASLDDDFAEQIAIRLVADKAEFGLVVCCTAEPSDGSDHPRGALIDAIESRLHVRGIPLRDALLIRDGRWLSYLCTDDRCCPPDGAPIPEATDVAAAHAMVGRSVLPSRKALEDRVRPVGFVARRALEQTMDRVGTEFANKVDAGNIDALRAEMVALVTTLIKRFDDPRAAIVSDEEAARVAVGLLDIHGRDLVMATMLEHDHDVVETLFIELARRTVPPDDAPMCTVLAAAAYANGNGALANVALDRAQASDPHYSLAGLLREALYQQVPPSLMRKAWKSAGREISQQRTNQQPRKKRKKTVRRS